MYIKIYLTAMPRIKHESQHLGAFTSNGVKCL